LPESEKINPKNLETKLKHILNKYGFKKGKFVVTKGTPFGKVGSTNSLFVLEN
jgi:pyruvate kinase